MQNAVGEFHKHECIRLAFRICICGADLGRLRNPSIAMGTAHNELQWGKPLWTHLWIDHVYYFAKKWRILSKFSCFAMEGSHRALKRMLRNSGGLSLLRGRLGVQVVIVACGQGACRGALESLLGLLGQIKGCTPVTLV